MHKLMSIAAVITSFAWVTLCLYYEYLQSCIVTKVSWILKVFVGQDLDVHEGTFGWTELQL